MQGMPQATTLCDVTQQVLPETGDHLVIPCMVPAGAVQPLNVL